jgi:hypothetical protein
MFLRLPSSQEALHGTRVSNTSFLRMDPCVYCERHRETQYVVSLGTLPPNSSLCSRCQGWNDVKYVLLYEQSNSRFVDMNPMHYYEMGSLQNILQNDDCILCLAIGWTFAQELDTRLSSWKSLIHAAICSRKGPLQPIDTIFGHLETPRFTTCGPGEREAHCIFHVHLQEGRQALDRMQQSPENKSLGPH